MNLTLVAILILTAAVAWWLSSHDPLVTGEDKAADTKRRAGRCGVTLFLVWAGSSAALYGGAPGGFVLVGVALPLAILWTGCLSDLFARGFHHLIDPDDRRDFDPQQSGRELDRLAGLVQTGQNEQAITLCASLLKSGEVSARAMETLLFHIYGQLLAEDHLAASPLLAQAYQLSREGLTNEAEARLEKFLQNDPQNLAATLLLLRVYGRNLARQDKAAALLRTIERRPGLPPGFVDYAQQSMREWKTAGPKEKCSEGIESLLVDKKYSQPPKP